MAMESGYLRGARSVTAAGQAAVRALDDRDDVAFQSALDELLSAARAREPGATAVAGFAPTGSARELAPQELDDALDQVLTELGVGDVLLSAAAVAGTPTEAASPSERGLLATAVANLNGTTQDSAGPAGLAFTGAPEADDDLHALIPATIDGIVLGVTTVGTEVVSGLALVPLSAVDAVIAAGSSAVPDLAGHVNAWVKAGTSAVERAVKALLALIPESLQGKVREWGGDWWHDHADDVENRAVRALLSVRSVQPLIDATLARGDLAADRVTVACAQLRDLGARYTKLSGVITKIVKVLRKLVGPVAAALTAAAPWIWGTGAFVYLIAFGFVLWSGRDYLDTGSVLQKVPGLAVILRDATA